MLQKRTILITGGGSGIGEALALQLAIDNKVVICGRNEEKLKHVVSKGKNIVHEVTDVSDFNSLDKLFYTLKEKNIVIDVLFNNAGVTELWDLNIKKFTSKEIFEKVNTNLSGAIALNQLFINQANHSVENLIVNITTEVAIFPIPIMPLYSASKAGLSIFTKSLRLQLKNTKFKVVEILPPSVETNMTKEVNNTGKLISPNDFARSVIKGIKKGKAEYAPGKNVFLFNMARRFFPVAGLSLIDKLSRKQLMGK